MYVKHNTRSIKLLAFYEVVYLPLFSATLFSSLLFFSFLFFPVAVSSQWSAKLPGPGDHERDLPTDPKAFYDEARERAKPTGKVSAPSDDCPAES